MKLRINKKVLLQEDVNALTDVIDSNTTDTVPNTETIQQNANEQQKPAFGNKVFGSETIANKLNGLSAGQLAGAAAGAGAVIGTGGHILGSTLSKRIRGAK